MTSQPENASSLAARLARHDPHAIAELYAHYGASVAARLPTDDLAVETFLRAWRVAPSLPPGTDLAEWLDGIAREVAGPGAAARTTAVSPRLPLRIMAAAGFEQRRFGFAPFLAGSTLLFLFAAFYFATREKGFAVETVQLRQELRTATIRNTDYREGMAILEARDLTTSAFDQGKLFVSPSRGILLIATRLTPSKSYEMSLVPESGAAIPAGTFDADRNGNAVHVLRGAVAPGSAAVQVALENRPVFTAKLPR